MMQIFCILFTIFYFVMKKSLFTLSVFLVGILVLQDSINAQQSTPNIMFFLIDDLGYSDIGCYGSEYYETPNIDRLASEGVKFTSAYSCSSVCSPSRAAILTGKNPGRLRITHAIPIQGYKRLKNTKLIGADYVKNLPLEEITIAEVLKEAGYKTATLGKWHVSWEEWGYPENQGFDLNVGGGWMGNPGNYFCPFNGKWRMTPDHPYREWNVISGCEEGDYLTDRLTEEAIKFIEDNKEGPFFLYLQHYAVHTPLQAKESLIQKYKRKKPDSIRDHSNPVYAAMIESVDKSVGIISEKLNELGLSENTIVIFTSDNGGHGRITSNWPLRGNKGNFYEGGIRVPLIVKWPDHMKAGTVNNSLFMGTDFYPTLLGLTGLPLKPKQHLDGVDLSSSLLNGEEVDREEPLIWHFPNYIGAGHPNPATPVSVIRDGDWKLIERFEDNTTELYNLKEDLSEVNNLSKELPVKVREKLKSWRNDVNVQLPVPNPDFDQ